MTRIIRSFILFLLVLVTTQLNGQTKEQRQEIMNFTNVSGLQELGATFKAKQQKEKQLAIDYANAHNLPIRKTLPDGTLIELQKVVDGKPFYFTTYNVDAATSTRTNYLHTNGGLNLDLNGQGMTAHVWDGGLARTTHQEYDGPGGNNRFSIGDTSTTLNFHAAHVTGTIMAYGAVPEAKGMAPRASAIGYDWNSDLAEATTAAANGMLLSNHSYGFAVRDDQGNPQLPAWAFGAYIDVSRDWDDIMYNAPFYLMVVAAGNDGNDDTANSSPMEGNAQFDKLTGHTISKNNMVVANAQDAIIGTGGSLTSVTINGSSSEGPTDDLRIKPDITGNGTDLFSSYETSDTAYNTITGTSMASPNVMGSLLILQEHYNDVNNNFMRAATLKGIALHTADDIGTTGPDAIHGWGLMNTKRAAQTISNNGNSSIISELTLTSGQSYQITVDASTFEDLQASISWTDLPGDVVTTEFDTSARLVNDLDIRITQNTNTFTPWRLTGATTNGQGDNNRDPYERVDVVNPSGTYTITVTHKGSLTSGSQNFSLIVTGVLSQLPCTATTPTNVTVDNIGFSDAYVTWDAVQGATYNVRFRESGTTPWNNVLTNNPEMTITGLSSNTTYQIRVRSICNGGTQSNYSTAVSFTTTALTYCDANGNDQSDEYIGRVQFSNIDNTTNAETNGYGDYTNLTATVDKGSNYNISVTPVWTGNTFPEGYAAYIDYNQDGDFTDANEQVWTQAPTGNTPVTGSISIPNDALSGNTRMRVIMSWNAIPNPCGTFGYGEVEDYTVNIVGANCQDITALNTDSITTDSITVSWTENNTPAATAWEVIAVTSGSAAPTIGATNATSNPFTITGLTESTTYDIYVRASCSTSFVSVSNIQTRTNYCDTTISDPGGISSQHGNNESQTFTICPDNPGDQVVINFSEFNLENNGTGCYDGLTIYDGDNLTATVIAPPNGGTAWCWDRDDAIPSGSGDLKNRSIAATSTSGCITLVFTSDAAEVRDGFAASISCESTVYLWDGTAWTNNPEGAITDTDNLYVNAGNPASLSSAISADQVFIDANASLTINNGEVNVYGDVSNDGTVDGSSPLNLEGASAQTMLGEGTIHNLSVNNPNGVAINESLSLTGTLDIQDGDLATNGNLTFKSDVINTAVLNTLNAGASITGLVTVERHLPAGNRSFRFMGSTVSGTSVFDSWQESGSNDAGFGIQITGTAGTVGTNNATSGLDETATGNPSMFSWDAANQSWDAVTNSKSEQLTPGEFYRVMVRGDRTTDLTTNSSSVTATTIRATGTLHTGAMTVNPAVSAGQFFAMANPYQSKLDLAQVAPSNVATDMYYWDPTLGTRGAYATIDIANGNSDVGNSSNVLEPGQAVFFVASNSNASITMNEAHKMSGITNAGIIRSASLNQVLKVKLYQTSRLMNNESESDGMYINFNSQFSDAIDFNDAQKLYGLNARLGILKANNQHLAVERRSIPAVNETINLYTANYLATEYSFKIELDQLPNRTVYLKDNLKNSYTLINAGGTTIYDFDIDVNDTASIASDRFEIVFQNSTLSNDDIAQLENQISIYPNPVAGDELNVNFGTLAVEQASITIYNSLGQLVHKEDLNPSSIATITNLESLANGVYLLEINTTDGTIVKRFIKK